MTEKLWLRRFRPRPNARVRLVCFPHAGGSAAFYRPWAVEASPEIEVLAVQYPGRMDRLGEPCVVEMDQLVPRIAEAVAPVVRRGPVAFFGHSLGAAVAYETARWLESWHGAVLSALFVSGRPAPQCQRSTAIHLADDDAVWAEVRRLGGAGEETLDHDGVRALALPALRADYRLAETYLARPGPPLLTPVIACIGDVDPEVTAEEADGWMRHTRGGFALRTFRGDHFYLIPRRHEVLGEVAGWLRIGVAVAAGAEGAE
jgi:pyochelin biosynthesis protein PchC